MKRFFILSVLGSSTGKSNQIFKLPIVPDEIWIRESKRKPIRVWSRTRTFDNVAPLEELFIVKQDDDGNYWVQFGDGKTGAKLPSGIDNVIAVYSSENSAGAAGELDSLVYGDILRARKLVSVRGAGHAYDGFYYVKSVTHRIDSKHYTTNFTLSRTNEPNTPNEIRVSGNNFSFFYGKLLTAEGFNNEQKYFTENRKLINRLIKEYQNEYCLISILLRSIVCFNWEIDGTFSFTVYPNNNVVVKKQSRILKIGNISGIGPKRTKLLKKKGITDVQDFYLTPAKELGEILDISEFRVRSIKEKNVSLLAKRPKDNRTDK